jgi:two-component system chemotaxis sensor kinase CheA
LRALTEHEASAVAAAPVGPTAIEAAASVLPPSHSPDAAGTTKLRETVKVDLERVDNLVAMVGELVVVESMVVNAPEIAKSASARVRNCLSQLAKVTRDLQDVGMRMRMLPVAGVFQKMARMSRDLGRKSGKQLRLLLAGETTEMDRSMVEQIADPLLHMIRNAVDHGIEPPDERRKAGKPEEGTIRLSAYHEGSSIVIELADDGRGLDRDAILAKARAQGLLGPDDTLSELEIHMLIFAPGFSTAKQVTEVSGRGVGMDVVKRNVEAVRGRVGISTTPGQGTTFKLVLPLTLAIVDGMLVACGQDRYIIPTLSVIESIQPTEGMLVTFAGQVEMINVRGHILPLVRLARLFSVTGAKSDPTQALVVIIEGMGRRVGLLVDEVVTQQQVVIKSLGQGLGPTRFLSGATILADGRVGLIINVEEIAGTTVERRQWTANESAAAPAVV